MTAVEVQFQCCNCERRVMIESDDRWIFTAAIKAGWRFELERGWLCPICTLKIDARRTDDSSIMWRVQDEDW